MDTVSDWEAEIISKFWQRAEGGTYPYRYKIAELVAEYSFAYPYQLLDLISEKSGVTACLPNFKCSDCHGQVLVNVRAELSRLARARTAATCGDCTKKQAIARIEDNINQLGNFSQNIDFPDFDETKLSQLSYVARLSLLTTLLDAQGKLKRQANCPGNVLRFTGEIEIETVGFLELIEAGAIHEIVDERKVINSILVETRRLIKKYRASINSSSIKGFNEFSTEQLQSGLYLIVPSIFPNLENYTSRLYADIMNSTIGMSDVNDIKELICKNRLDSAYFLLGLVLKKHLIPVNRNTKLDTVLSNLVMSYSLPIVYSTLSYNAGLVAQVLFSRPSWVNTIGKNLLAKNVESYVADRIKNNKIFYEYSLPITLIESKTESFSSYYILGELTSWSELSGNNILELWLKSPTIKFEE